MVTRQRQVHRTQSSTSRPPAKLSTSSDESPSKRSSINTRRKRAKRFYLVTLAMLLTLCFLTYFLGYDAHARVYSLGTRAIDHLAGTLNLHEPFHVIIIDAGSTASRVLVYKFHPSVLDSLPVLDDELFYEVKPGLSSFADEPRKIEVPLGKLLAKAKSVVPEADWPRTPLRMRATAGLRLLPGAKAQQLLDEARRIFVGSGFLVNDDAVAILDASDEGLFSWFTVNYLLDTLQSVGRERETTVAAFDLGGGSTQVTFFVRDSDLEADPSLQGHPKRLYRVNIFGVNATLYSRSYLGLGLMAAREKILTHPDNRINETEPEDKIAPRNDGFVEIHSECINEVVKNLEWNYGGTKYLVNGPYNATHKIIKSQMTDGLDEDAPVVRFENCFSIAQKVVQSMIGKGIPNLSDRDINIFSYYYDRATESGLIDPFEGGEIDLKDYYKAAQDTCGYPNTDQPFMCLDLTFIYVLLHDGFGLNDLTRLSLKKNINGHEISWALGAGFNLIQNFENQVDDV